MATALRFVLVVLVVSFSGCSGSAGPASATGAETAPGASSADLASAGPGGASTAPATLGLNASEVAVSTENPFRLASTAFSDGGTIPRRFTCDGDNVSPDLEWSGAPGETASFVLVVDDPDARGFVHWLVFDMTGSSSGGLPEAVSSSPDAPPQGLNDFRKVGYGGPCPPSGRHHYRFTLYALDRMLELAGTPGAAEVQRAMVDHVIGQATLGATYARR